MFTAKTYTVTLLKKNKKKQKKLTFSPGKRAHTVKPHKLQTVILKKTNKQNKQQQQQIKKNITTKKQKQSTQPKKVG